MKKEFLFTIVSILAVLFVSLMNEAEKPPESGAAAPPPAGETGIAEPVYVHGKKVTRTYQARVIRIVDGDTVELLLADNSHPNCRLDSIDAPEAGQAFGARATEALKQLAIGKIATVYETAIDRYGRPSVFLAIDNIDVSAWMVAQGLAWEYRQYSKSDSLQQYEAQARQTGAGLWRLANATPPWEWRRRR